MTFGGINFYVVSNGTIAFPSAVPFTQKADVVARVLRRDLGPTHLVSLVYHLYNKITIFFDQFGVSWLPFLRHLVLHIPRLLHKKIFTSILFFGFFSFFLTPLWHHGVAWRCHLVSKILILDFSDTIMVPLWYYESLNNLLINGLILDSIWHQ